MGIAVANEACRKERGFKAALPLPLPGLRGLYSGLSLSDAHVVHRGSVRSWERWSRFKPPYRCTIS
jgi:hypothetical protein